jgi:hypothetical protein
MEFMMQFLVVLCVVIAVLWVREAELSSSTLRTIAGHEMRGSAPWPGERSRGEPTLRTHPDP